MPRSPTLYSLPPGTTPQLPNTVIQSATFNAAMDDIAQTFNTVTPTVYGGTGSATQEGALLNIGVNSFVKDTLFSNSVSGTANSILLATTVAITGYVDKTVTFLASATNSGPVTLNLGGAGPKPIIKFTDSGLESQLVATDILQNQTYTVSYFTNALSGSGAWVLRNPNRFQEGSYAVTITAASGSFSNANGTAYFRRSGPIVFVTARLNLIDRGDAAGRVRMNLPITSSSAIIAGGGSGIISSGSAGESLNVIVGQNALTADIVRYDGTSVAQSGYVLDIYFTYQIA